MPNPDELRDWVRYHPRLDQRPKAIARTDRGREHGRQGGQGGQMTTDN